MSTNEPQPSNSAGPKWRRAVADDNVGFPDLLAGEDLKASPKQVRGHRAREALLAAAHVLFAQHGYEATTVEEVSKAAGVAVGGFYRHFRSKRQVLLVLMRGLLDEFEASRSTRQFNESPDEAIERLRLGLKTRWRHEGAYRAWREAVVRDPALAALHAAMEAVVTANIASTLAIAASSPSYRQGVDVATLASIVNVLFWRFLDTPGEREAGAETMTLLIRHALFEDTALEAVPVVGPGPRSAPGVEPPR